jgi:hypothetical protein
MSDWIPGEVETGHWDFWSNEDFQDYDQMVRSHVHSQEVIDNAHAIIDDLRTKVAYMEIEIDRYRGMAEGLYHQRVAFEAELVRVTAERDTLQLTIDAIECKLIAFDEEAIEYAEEGDFVLPWLASVNGKGESFETAVQAFVAVRSASKGGPDCTPDPTSPPEDSPQS